MRLLISGVGRIQCQAAVEFMSDQYDHTNHSIWINYGIAGHRKLSLGTAVIADKVSTVADETTWYPSLLFDVPCRTGEITTFDAPITTYPSNVCCEMEASGFLTAASKIAPNELCHVLKIVSDNEEAGIENINRESIQTLIRNNLDILHTLVERLSSLASQLPEAVDHNSLDSILRLKHFTYAQMEQLGQLNRRYRALLNTDKEFQVDLEGCATAAQILDKLARHINAIPLRPPWVGTDD
jgi:hypothetical protein